MRIQLMNYLTPFIAVAIGFFVASFFAKKELKLLPMLLAFSGSFLLSVTVFELLPLVFEASSDNLGLYVMGGILLQLVLDFFSKGAEHGHVHAPTGDRTFPWLLFISLSLHALIEGFPIHESESILYAVIVHKVPIAIILTLFFIKAQYPRTITMIFLFVFALMTPLGSWLSEEMAVLEPYHLHIDAIAVGIFLHVSTTILFESSKDHKFNLAKLVSIFLGVGLAYLL